MTLGTFGHKRVSESFLNVTSAQRHSWSKDKIQCKSKVNNTTCCSCSKAKSVAVINELRSGNIRPKYYALYNVCAMT